MAGRCSNGRKDWRQQGTDLTYGQWLENQVDQINLSQNTAMSA